ncbi:MAG TPA: enoyl-CoA hydratase-related protein [Acidimicrobiales bacterium]|nr:enoyl-CoA hydratase-related protein [Acidimicrobiales bacterium]
MAEDGTIRYDVDGHVARVTIDRPERRNALTWGLVAELRAAFARAGGDAGVRVCVLTGAGDRAFCAGADLGGMAGEPGAVLAAHEGRGQLAELFRELYGLGKPTVARVRGYALAGGFGLALACDLVVAADDAVFGAPEIDVGLWPHMITVPLIRSMPPKVALELMMTGRRVGADEGARLGFVSRVAPVDGLDAAVDELAGTLAGKSPAALRLGRDAFYAVWDRDVDTSLRILHPLLGVTAATEDAAEGLAAFRDKRPPEWTGR